MNRYEQWRQVVTTDYFDLPSGPCGWKYCGTEGCIVKWDTGTPCKEAADASHK